MVMSRNLYVGSRFCIISFRCGVWRETLASVASSAIEPRALTNKDHHVMHVLSMSKPQKNESRSSRIAIIYLKIYIMINDYTSHNK